MSIRLKHIIAVTTALLLGALSMSAQVDRRDVRAGNRQFRKENWREADIDYRKALVKDSTSIAANYNLASNLYRQGNFDEAAKVMEKIKETAPATANAADYYYNTGDIAIEKKDWQGAVNAFKEALLRNPADMDAKENYIYAKKMLENQKNGGGGQNRTMTRISRMMTRMAREIRIRTRTRTSRIKTTIRTTITTTIRTGIIRDRTIRRMVRAASSL